MRYRVDGLSDPVTCIHMGSFKLRNGGVGYFLIFADRVDNDLIAEFDSGGLPGHRCSRG